MAYRGTNTLILEFKQQLLGVTNHYINEGVPLSAIYLATENVLKELEEKVTISLKEEYGQYNNILAMEDNSESDLNSSESEG